MSDALAVREATRADLDILLAIENESFDSDRLTRAALRRAIASASQQVLIVERDGVAIGSAIVEFRKGSKKARLSSIAVRKQFAGQGFGRLLIGACEQRAREEGRDTLRLEVRADNVGAIALYGKLGYMQFEEIDDYYEDGATALRFEKTLFQRERVGSRSETG